MTVPKINSAHGSDTRNVINRAIDVLNQQGKSIQDLVAEGQLTEEQYAELLTTINSLVKSGNVDKSDLTPEFKDEIEGFSTQLAQKANNVDVMNKMASKRDKSNLIGVNDFDGETLGYLQDGAGGATINIESVPKDKSVTPEKTDFVSVDQRNLFDKTKAADGYRLSTSGEAFEDADYTLSDFIRVQNGADYKVGFAVEGYNTYRICAYDKDENFIKMLTSSLSYGVLTVDITIDFDGYIRVPFEKAGKDIALVANADVYDGSFHPYQIVGGDYFRTKPLARSVGNGEIEIGGVTAENTDFLTQTKNLFNKNTATLDSNINANDGTTTTYDGLHATDFIRVRKGEQMSISSVRQLAYYNTNKVYLGSGSFINNPDNTPLTITPSNDGYIRVSFLAEHLDNLQVQKGNTINEYEPYGYKFPYLISNSENTLAGKSVLGFGDSIMYAGLNGFLEMIANENGMTAMNYSSSGATIAPRDGYDNQIIKKVREAITAGETADYILFNGLTNDANVTDESRLGEISTGYDMPSDVTTFSGAFEELIKTIRDEWVASKIIYVRVHNMDSRGDRQILFGERAIEICKKWSIPVVDLYNEGNLNTQIAEMKRLYTEDTYDTGLGDGTHPNEDGYRRFYVPPIEAKMKAV